MLGSAGSEQPRLINHEIIFEELQPMWARLLNVTDGQTIWRSNTALYVASRGKNDFKNLNSAYQLNSASS